jgi:hypothetical protein
MNTTTFKGETYPLLKADKKGRIDCPFCKQKHTHGNGGGNGHRLAHCTALLIHNPIFFDGKSFKKEDGYFVEFD